MSAGTVQLNGEDSVGQGTVPELVVRPRTLELICQAAGIDGAIFENPYSERVAPAERCAENVLGPDRLRPYPLGLLSGPSERRLLRLAYTAGSAGPRSPLPRADDLHDPCTDLS
jgi:hypothetical protein